MKFEQDGLRFVGIMAIIAGFGVVYTVVIQIFGCVSTGQAVVKALDLVTITIPPGKLMGPENKNFPEKFSLPLFLFYIRPLKHPSGRNSTDFDSSDIVFKNQESRKSGISVHGDFCEFFEVLFHIALKNGGLEFFGKFLIFLLLMYS